MIGQATLIYMHTCCAPACLFCNLINLHFITRVVKKSWITTYATLKMGEYVCEPRFTSEPIAIVGSSCRFPGGASSPSKLWELLRQPRDVLSEIPPSRFNTIGRYHPDSQHHGVSNQIASNMKSISNLPGRVPTSAMRIYWTKTPGYLTATSLASAPGKPSPWTRNSVCSLRQYMRA